MSYVTNVIISGGFVADQERMQIEGFEWDVRGQPRTVGPLTDVKNVDGTHHRVGHLFTTGLNYFDEEKFLAFLDTIDWYSPESVFVIIRNESWNECGPNQQDVWRPKGFRDPDGPFVEDDG